MDTLFELLEALPRLLPEAEAQHAAPSESTPPPLLQQVEPVVEPLLEPVTEASGLGPAAETAPAPSEPVTDATHAAPDPATDPAPSEESGLQAPAPVSGG
ncbi:MAG: hypothetical protein M3N52_13670 [Actinomycetota bacterium]|nr:hypothetical protein [Actinomycetota bacterium]